MTKESGSHKKVPTPEPASAGEPLPPAVLPPETTGDVEQLKNQAAKAQEFYNQLLRTAADFDNFKKRAARERLDASRQSTESLLSKLIPILDNFDIAITTANSAGATSVQSILTGMNMIHSQLKSVLAESGLEEIEAHQQPFNPAWHEAVAQEETDAVPEGHVVQQHRKGYKSRDRLLRPAAVVVAKKPGA